MGTSYSSGLCPLCASPLSNPRRRTFLQFSNLLSSHSFQLRNGARNARSDDTKNLKAAIVPWLQKMFPNMEPLDPESREEHGDLQRRFRTSVVSNRVRLH